MKMTASAIGLLSLISLAACSSFAANPTASVNESAVSSSGRSSCPGSVASVESNLTGAPADALEQAQAAYENDPGFMAVVFDGTKTVVVVQASSFPTWQSRLVASGTAVAPSCVDAGLVAAVLAVLPSFAGSGNTVSGGYNGLDDSIDVLGVDADTLISALDKADPGMGTTARAAIAVGTLRIDPSHIIDSTYDRVPVATGS